MMRARARNDHPISSHLAAEDAERGGSAASQRRLCLVEVIQEPGQTSAEIAGKLNLKRHAPSSRLPEMRRAGLVYNGPYRICKVTGRLSMTWYPVWNVDEIEGEEERDA